MSTFSPMHWLAVLIPVIGLQAVPIVRILRRAGVNSWWTVAYFVPFFGWLSLWAFAFSPWPRVEDAAGATSIQGPVGGA